MPGLHEEFVGWIVQYIKIPLWAIIAIVAGIFLLGLAVIFRTA